MTAGKHYLRKWFCATDRLKMCYAITKERGSHGAFPLFFVGLTEDIEAPGWWNKCLRPNITTSSLFSVMSKTRSIDDRQSLGHTPSAKEKWQKHRDWHGIVSSSEHCSSLRSFFFLFQIVSDSWEEVRGGHRAALSVALYLPQPLLLTKGLEILLQSNLSLHWLLDPTSFNKVLRGNVAERRRGWKDDRDGKDGNKNHSCSLFSHYCCSLESWKIVFFAFFLL